MGAHLRTSHLGHLGLERMNERVRERVRERERDRETEREIYIYIEIERNMFKNPAEAARPVMQADALQAFS